MKSFAPLTVPYSYDEVESLAKDVMATPTDVVARMKKLLGDS